MLDLHKLWLDESDPQWTKFILKKASACFFFCLLLMRRYQRGVASIFVISSSVSAPFERMPDRRRAEAERLTWRKNHSNSESHLCSWWWTGDRICKTTLFVRNDMIRSTFSQEVSQSVTLSADVKWFQPTKGLGIGPVHSLSRRLQSDPLGQLWPSNFHPLGWDFYSWCRNTSQNVIIHPSTYPESGLLWRLLVSSIQIKSSFFVQSVMTDEPTG